MFKTLTFSLIILISIKISAQTGINTPNPDPSSILDITSSNKGVLLPRMTLTSLDQQLSDVPNAVSLIIYNIGSATIPKGIYSWDGSSWVQFINKTEYDEKSYWFAQGTTVPKTDNKSNKNGNSPSLSAVDASIYQKGNVGIGYSNQYDINFEVNTSKKKLEVGGDFRASYQDPTTKLYYGIETNSVALPSQYAARGNIIYNSVSKNLEDYSYFTRPYDGSMFIQSKDMIMKLARTGRSDTSAGAFAHEKTFDSKSTSEIIYAVKNDLTTLQLVKEFNKDKFAIYNDNNHNVQFGLDFNKGNFYIGDLLNNSSRYYFPKTKPFTTGSDPVEKDNQILKYNKATSTLEWSDNNSTPKFFYMPSVVLPTIAQDPLIQTGATANYTYDSSNQIFSVNLYALFGKQFSTPIQSSKANANLSEFVLSNTSYDYFVTYADDKVFDISSINLSATGILTYKVNINAIIKTGSFMNIVLKVNN